MALINGKNQHLFTTYQESKSGNENAPQTYKKTDARVEHYGEMNLPVPTYMMESDRGKLGSGQHGTKSEVQAIYTPYSYTRAERLSEFCHWLAFMLGGGTDVNTIDTGVYSHEIKALGTTTLDMPTFTMEYGNTTANEVIAGCVVNDGSITIPLSGDSTLWESTFNGWGNNHYPNSGTLTKMSTGTMSSASEDYSGEPLLNGKCCSVYRSTAMEASFGHSSVDYTDSDLTGSPTDITSLIQSITIGFNNGMSAGDKMRGSGCGIINDWTRGLPSVTLSMTLRKNTGTVNWHTLALAETQSAIEILFQGPVISGAYRYALDIFFPVVQVTAKTEDREVPITGELTFDVFEDSNGDAMMAYAQTAVDESYIVSA